MTLLAWIVFVAAAILEVGGDAVIRKGLRGGMVWLIIAGFLVLGCYGVVVNTVKWDFSRLLGVYVAVFVVVSVMAGRFVFKETIPLTTWAGLAIIVIGGTVIQMGQN
jgi:drug/metabolite transporter superfamily protein YnfA